MESKEITPATKRRIATPTGAFVSSVVSKLNSSFPTSPTLGRGNSIRLVEASMPDISTIPPLGKEEFEMKTISRTSDTDHNLASDTVDIITCKPSLSTRPISFGPDDACSSVPEPSSKRASYSDSCYSEDTIEELTTKEENKKMVSIVIPTKGTEEVEAESSSAKELFRQKSKRDARLSREWMSNELGIPRRAAPLGPPTAKAGTTEDFKLSEATLALAPSTADTCSVPRVVPMHWGGAPDKYYPDLPVIKYTSPPTPNPHPALTNTPHRWHNWYPSGQVDGSDRNVPCCPPCRRRLIREHAMPDCIGGRSWMCKACDDSGFSEDLCRGIERLPDEVDENEDLADDSDEEIKFHRARRGKAMAGWE